MNPFPKIYPIIILLSITLWSCKSESPSQKEIIASGYPDDVAPILLTNCAIPTCHEGSAAEQNLDLSTWEGMFSGSEHGAVVIPFSAEWSPLFLHINTFSELGPKSAPVMPPDDAEPLSMLDVSTLKDWIQNGALNRSGENYWAQTTTENKGKVFTLCAGSDLVAVSDLNSNLNIRFVEVGRNPGNIEAPHYITLSPDKAFFYLTLLEGGLLEKYRTDNYELAGRVEVGATPAHITVSPDGKRAIVSHWNDLSNSPKLTMIDTETMAIVQAINAGGDFLSFPHGLTTNGDFSRVYVCANKGNYIMQLDIDENGFDNPEPFSLDPVNSPVPFPSDEYQPYQIILSPDESQLFVTCNKKNEVRILNPQTHQLIAAIPTGLYPRLMDYDADSKQLFVTCRDEPNPDNPEIQGCVAVINTENHTLVKKVFGVGHAPHGISIDKSHQRIFVSSENLGGKDEVPHPIEGISGPSGKYHLIDMGTLEVAKEMERQLGIFPSGLVISG